MTAGTVKMLQLHLNLENVESTYDKQTVIVSLKFLH